MKIQYALMSCNSNMNYLGYWPVVARAWRKLNITPVLFFIRDSDAISPPPADGIVHTLEPLAGVEMSAQYTCARFWGAHLYLDDVVAISDIDLMPLSNDYFVGQLQDIPDDRYVHLGTLNMVRQARRLALLSDPNAEWSVRTDDVWKIRAFCHIARGRLLKKVLALPDTWEQTARTMALYNLDQMLNDDRGRTLSARWGGDEWYPTAKIHAYQDQSIFTVLVHKNAYLSPEGQLLSRGRRLDGWGGMGFDSAQPRPLFLYASGPALHTGVVGAGELSAGRQPAARQSAEVARRRKRIPPTPGKFFRKNAVCRATVSAVLFRKEPFTAGHRLLATDAEHSERYPKSAVKIPVAQIFLNRHRRLRGGVGGTGRPAHDFHAADNRSERQVTTTAPSRSLTRKNWRLFSRGARFA